MGRRFRLDAARRRRWLERLAVFLLGALSMLLSRRALARASADDSVEEDLARGQRYLERWLELTIADAAGPGRDGRRGRGGGDGGSGDGGAAAAVEVVNASELTAPRFFEVQVSE